jgi:hypothetical protein
MSKSCWSPTLAGRQAVLDFGFFQTEELVRQGRVAQQLLRDGRNETEQHADVLVSGCCGAALLKERPEGIVLLAAPFDQSKGPLEEQQVACFASLRGELPDASHGCRPELEGGERGENISVFWSFQARPRRTVLQ